MNIRNRTLPEGWYPSSEEEIRDLLSLWRPNFASGAGKKGAIAGIVPHAGWTFCGSMIAEVLSSFEKNLETIVVFGGHNPFGGPLIEYSEDFWNLPGGRLERDIELSEAVMSKVPSGLKVLKERSTDNTVEVIMPLIGALFPHVKWAAWRLPADSQAINFGKILADAVKETGSKTAVIASTDLTHYGPNYGFTPGESLESPVPWVEGRDREILNAMTGFDGEKVLELARRDKSACSAGAAAGVMNYAGNMGCNRGRILKYATSRDIYPSDSFVGYGSVIWEPS